MRLDVGILGPIGQFPRSCEERGRKMSPKLKVTRDRREDERAPSRHPRLGARAAALVVLGGGVVGLWAAPMAHAAGHDSHHRSFHSSRVFTFPDGEAQVDLSAFKDDEGVDDAYDRQMSKGDEDADDQRAFKDEADADGVEGADDEKAYRGGKDDDYFDPDYDLWDFFGDGLRITVNVNNNNNNNNAANANNNNNNNNGSRTNVNNN